MHYEILRGDCLAVLRTLPDSSFDSIVTDPPYELGFMGKSWDASGIAYNVEMWAEALRVLKPGGHLLAFSGSRTYHRMTCAIEDSGFEVRDQIQWIYGSGFPKSNNLDKLRGTVTCGCMVESMHDTSSFTRRNESAPAGAARIQPQAQHNVRPVQGVDVPAPESADQERRKVLLPGLPEQSASGDRAPHCAGEYEGRQQSSLEGRGDDVQAQGQLQGDPVRASAGAIAADGAQGRVHDGAPAGDSAVVRLPADTHGGGAPHRPRPDKQPPQQSGAVAGQPQPQTGGAWPLCGGCGLPVVAPGLGTALKPAHEPICVARKPLVGTVAANVLAHGTGAINIDGCRVATDQNRAGSGGKGGIGVYGESVTYDSIGSPLGRWPANLIHDGSAEVLAAFPDAKGQQGATTQRQQGALYGAVSAGEPGIEPRNDAGSAARFFYCAKASRSDRGPFNTHPTVKPLALMRYLLRLVTPPGGRALDPFAGSGSTIVAGLQEGLRMTGIELHDEHADIADYRAMTELSGGLV